MIIKDAILRLRDAAPLFQRRVGGTAAFASAMQPNAGIDLPFAFIVPMITSAQAPEGNSSAQVTTERFGVVVAVDNSVSPQAGEGLSALDSLSPIKQQILNAFLGWTPPNAPGATGAQFIRDFHVDLNQQRLWHQYDFQVSYYVDVEEDSEPQPVHVTDVWLGKVPNVGIGHEQDYVRVGGDPE